MVDLSRHQSHGVCRQYDNLNSGGGGGGVRGSLGAKIVCMGQREGAHGREAIAKNLAL